MRFKLALLLPVIIGFLFPAAHAARACGGGLVTARPGTIGADAQRIIISARDGTTDVITQIGVPSTTADYGVLIPLPSEPTLDGTPVASADIDNLDRQTAPRLMRFAVTLTAETGDAINAWLADNGFVIPAADQALVADYAGPGRYFIAIRRSDTAATQVPSRSFVPNLPGVSSTQKCSTRTPRQDGSPFVPSTT